MTKQEAISWFWNKFNLCYSVQHYEYKENIYMFYDEQFIRQKKLSKLSGKENKIPNKIKGVCLFELDLKNNFFWYDYNEIYLFLFYNYSCNSDIINSLIFEILKDTIKSNELIFGYKMLWTTMMLKDTNKLTIIKY